MSRRFLAAAAVALSVAATATPSHAAKSVKLYLNEHSPACADGTSNVITTSPDDKGACVYLPRLLVDGQGWDTTSESFASVKKLPVFRIDSTKQLTGTFALFGSSGARSIDGAAVVTADFTIKLAGKAVGTVRVDGVATPSAPATKSFSLPIPSSLNNVRTNKAVVSVGWYNCVGRCGVSVSGKSFMVVPTR